MELIREGDGKWKIAAIDFASLHEFEKNGRVTDEVQKKIDLLKNAHSSNVGISLC